MDMINLPDGHASALQSYDSGERYELVRFTKDGLLTKLIRLGADGTLVSDGSQCWMANGRAERVCVQGPAELAALIGALGQNQALALGRLRDGVANAANVITKDALVSAGPGGTAISRSRDYIQYQAGAAAFVLIDIDCKGMPAATAARIQAAGGYEAILTEVLPALGRCGRVVRASTGSGIYRGDTGAPLAGSNGLHILLTVTDGGDAERFLGAFHERCWAAGFGWHMTGAAGQLLERSLIDKAVCAPERLVFEAPPWLEPPLAQDQAQRRPRVHAGPAMDTAAACPAPDAGQAARIADLKRASAEAMQPERKRVRAAFVRERGEALAVRTGMSGAEARAVIERQCDGVLRPDVDLPWDDAALAGMTAGDVLRDPARFTGETLADPLEGVAYGPQKAKVLARPDGSLFINSFAHGGVKYDLKYDARTIRTLIETTAKAEVARLWQAVSVIADLDALEYEELRNAVHKKSGISKKTLSATIVPSASGKPAGGGDRDAMLEGMNAKYMVVNETGKAMVYKPVDDAVLNRRYYQRIKFDDLEKLHMNEVVWINEKPVTVAKLWLQHPDRKQYIGGIVFDPSGVHAKNDELNLWQGFAVTPRPGSWICMKRHIYQVICRSNDAHYHYIINWMARAVQFPAMVGEVAVVMKGGEGVGKGMLARAMRYVFGQHGLHITNAKHLTGNFNLHLRDTVLLFADEAFFAGDKAHIGTLNGLITEPHLAIEGKGRDVIYSPNYLHVMMASNSDWVVPASIGARRFFVLDVPDIYKGNRAYFKAIAEEMENGGYEAMLHELLHCDLTGFEVRDIPDSDALQEQKKLSLPVAEAWWMDVLLRGYVWKSKLHLPYFMEWQDKVTTELLFQSYADYAREARERRPLSREAFGLFLKRMGGLAGRWRNGVIGEQGTGPMAGTTTQDRAKGYYFGNLGLARGCFVRATKLAVDWEPRDDIAPMDS